MNLRSTLVSAVQDADRDGSSDAKCNALLAVDASELDALLHASLNLGGDVAPIAVGTGASPGACTGAVVFSAEEALAAAERGEKVVLVRPETTPDDVLGMQASVGIITARGGLASHAAVVARGWGIPAVVGLSTLSFTSNSITIGDLVLSQGEQITIDGRSGAVFLGALDIGNTDIPSELDTLLAWADAVADGKVTVRANADTAHDARRAREAGARGIGLCRTEHMFLAADRLPIMRSVIMTTDAVARERSLDELERVQTDDFVALFSELGGDPVTVRLLDPPLHEFLPNINELTVRELNGSITEEERATLGTVRQLAESNPMLGTRGVRLAALRPGLYEMQVRAICSAIREVGARGGRARVEIMIPLVIDPAEVRLIKQRILDVVGSSGVAESGDEMPTIGAMIETPRAALLAARIAPEVDFISFGTNDLTQMTLGFSRDDVEAELVPMYRSLGLLEHNPFEVIDEQGVGQLVTGAARDGRNANPSLKIGVCGEHAGHPYSIGVLLAAGCESVSCSPYRVKIARLAVAQSLLRRGVVTPGTCTFPEVPRTQATIIGGNDGSATSSPQPATQLLDVDDIDVLRVLRLRGFATEAGFVESLGAFPHEILQRLVAEEQVRFIEARAMYALLPNGKARFETSSAEQRVASLGSAYADFLVLNDMLKQACTNWQMRDGEPNAHDDATYDESCIGALDALHARAMPVMTALANEVHRLERYGDRLGRALDALREGDTTRFTGVMCESYHDVWMELHEDLILLQGIDRTAEGSF